jgi:hypothetical protein
VSTSAATTPRRTCWATSVRASCGRLEDAGNTARNYGEFEYMRASRRHVAAVLLRDKSVENGGDPAQLTAPT